ncbi:decaprenyl-phosphate phosphoribosyltransferase [Rubrobacter taiwanensis]|jgi:4-hydroxybenzoate polyprenyltransferase|uniref:Decaprenyl-phosphate phosphoribosyltransferase n=1 Tax=Rubrobacter taiwanensis TaxID=185139 RepID=A0A4R1BTJ1_9ACTN|nr:decaprenyl-phosphate phosphoribosyltransferase [Rubrobacter taiwanensis]TCJ20595.1 decaprenyl-phosphate phosphoribosyltransferase [Rubrobacter taiwanensis]
MPPRFVVKLPLMEAGHPRSPLRAYLKLARPKQWTKNGFVLAGVIFAEQALQLSSLLAALLAFAAFCALSGAVYAANDALDVEEDRKHPRKRHRPVASGEISVRAALAYAGLLAAGGLALGFSVSWGVGAAGGAYLLLQVAYALWLKHFAILDVMAIAFGFVLRALAGAAAVMAPISPWLIACTGLLALFLGFSKRRYELASLGEGAQSTRRNLADYSVPMLDEMMTVVLAATIMAYSLYTFFAYEGVWMMVSIPFVIYGVFRYMLLVHRDGGDNPDVLLLKDRPLQVTLLLWLAVVMVILYVVR